MQILIDADGCPVVKSAVSAAKNHNLPCLIICDTSHTINDDYAETITVSKGADSADFYLVNMVKEGDIVITQDYGLAAMALAKKALPISQNGLQYSEQNIDSMLMSRHTAKKIRRSGGRLKGPSKRTEQQNLAFEKSLEGLILKNKQNV